jgi:hypothetical protein
MADLPQHFEQDTRTSTTRRKLLGAMGAVALAPMGIAGCGGSRDEPASIRFVNATVDSGDLTAQLDGDTLATLQPGDATGFIGIEDKSQTLRLKADGVTLLERGIDPGRKSHVTAVLHGSASSLQLAVFEDETEGKPGGGECKVRLFNGSDNGSLDLFLTSPNADISVVPPAVSATAELQFSSYAQVSSGSRRLRIARNGDRNDVRLDVASVELPSAGVVTVVVLPTRSARLLQAVLLVHEGSSTKLANPFGRSVFVNAMASTAMAAPQIDTAVRPALAGGGTSEVVNVAAGDRALGFVVNGGALTEQRTVAAATDTTCVVYGDAGSPQLAFLADDNRSSTVTTQVKLRLGNFAVGVNTASLLVDLASADATAAYGAASAYVQVNVGERDLAVAGGTGATLASLADQALVAEGVYTLFLLGTAAAPQLVLRRDR